MAGSGYQGAYGNPAWGAPPAGSTGWDSPRGIGPAGPHGDGYGVPPWHPARAGKFLPIAVMILGFILWWPVGLAILAYLIWSGRMACWSRRGDAGGNGDRRQGWRGPWGGPWSGPWGAWYGWRCERDAAPPSSGNRAFDEYRAETLRRLEEEQREFNAFLDRLRFAKDKAEFDQFMAERRRTPPSQPAPEQPPAA